MVFAKFIALPARTSTHKCVSIILGVLTLAPIPIDSYSSRIFVHLLRIYYALNQFARILNQKHMVDSKVSGGCWTCRGTPLGAPNYHSRVNVSRTQDPMWQADSLLPELLSVKKAMSGVFGHPPLMAKARRSTTRSLCEESSYPREQCWIVIRQQSSIFERLCFRLEVI